MLLLNAFPIVIQRAGARKDFSPTGTLGPEYFSRMLVAWKAAKRGGIADIPGAARAPVRCSSLELSPNEMRS